MMKLVLGITLALALGSCSSEWKESDEKTFMDVCKEKMYDIDCDCAMKKVKEKYPDINEWNEKGGKDKDLAAEIASGC